MRLIRASGENLTLLIAKGNDAIAAKVSSTSCWCSDINFCDIRTLHVCDGVRGSSSVIFTVFYMTYSG